ncbi:MAG: thermonuclease family protein [Phycisphaerae bacterium]|nr:thermonuclease family protein [Phycisphaerae bacterium]
MELRRSCPLLGVVDSDILKVEWEGGPQLVRLMDVDPERAVPGGPKRTTDFGRRTLRWVKDVFLKEAGEVDLEFAGEEVALSNRGDLLAYVFVRGENYNVRLVREGWSPCFDKYGHPRIHREAMEQAELRARFEGRGVWGGRGGRGDYDALKAYWLLRAGQVDDYRHATAMGEDVLSCRLDYRDVVQRAKSGTDACVFADLSKAFHMADGSMLIQLGSPQQPLSAFFAPGAAAVAGFLEREFLGFGKPNYLYFHGTMGVAGEQPQITIDRLEQVAAFPPSNLE